MEKQEPITSIEIEGKTIDEAIQKGLEELSLTRDQVDVKILNEGSTGLFGLMGAKPSKVKLQKKQNGITQDIKTDQLKSMVDTFTGKLLELMYFRNIKITSSIEGNEVKIPIKTTDAKDSALLIGRDGKTLSSLELIIQSVVNHYLASQISKEMEQPRLKVLVDINNYRMRQEEKIRDTIVEAIGIVKKTREDYQFSPMSARSRRMIHLAIQDNPELETFSEGEGRERKVILRLKKQVD
jgi:spoIIIJ-associated protein